MPKTAERITGPTPWDKSFRNRAACLGLGAVGDNFYPKNGKIPDEIERLCQSCLIGPSCREYAIRHESKGYWGGTTAKQRTQIRRQRGIEVVEPKKIVKGWLRSLSQPPGRFGPTRNDIDQARADTGRYGLDDLTHPDDWA